MRSRFAVPATIVAAVSLLAAPSAHAARVLVKVRPGADARQVLRAHGARQLRTIPHTGFRVVLAPSVRSLRGAAGVAVAEPDAIALPQETLPSDPYVPAGSFAIDGGAWGAFTTHTTQAWDVTQGDPGVTVAVLDTGLRPQGLNFGDTVLPGWNVLTGTSDVTTNAGVHGTYVAGIVGGQFDDGTGSAGYCPRCSILPVQVGTDSGGYTSDLAAGITWAADHGARVINLSWASAAGSSALSSAVSYARSKGAVVFAAAGNSNCDCPQYPAATPGVLGVGGYANTGAKAGDSNSGSWVALAAPEGSMTAWPALNGAPGYGAGGGTSLASPAAAGIAGLLLSADPALTGAQVEAALESSATPAQFSVRYGQVDAMAALAAIGRPDPQASSAPVNVSAPRVLLGTNGVYNTAPLAGAPQVGQLLVRGQGAWKGSTGLALTGSQWYRCTADGSSCSLVASGSRYTVASADSGSALKLKVTVKNALGSVVASSPLTAPVGGTTQTTAAPASTAAPAISGTAQAGQTLTASTGTWSGSPTGYAYQWRRCDGSGGACGAIAGATAQSYAVASGDVGATLQVAVTATNAGGSATATSAVTAAVQAAPAVQPATQTLTFSGSLGAKGGSQTFALSAGAGASHATLSFTKCSSMTLALQTSGGAALASATGASGLSVDRDLTAGGYRYAVSGASRCSFTLTTTTVAP